MSLGAMLLTALPSRSALCLGGLRGSELLGAPGAEPLHRRPFWPSAVCVPQARRRVHG